MPTDARVPVTMRDFFFDDPFFQTSWDDFDKVRGAMFSESRDTWKKFDEDFRELRCMEPALEKGGQEQPRSLARQESGSKWEEGWMFPRRWMLPSLNSPLKQLDLFNSKDSELIRMKEDDTKLEVSLDTSDYRPEELHVSVEGGMLCVEAKHQEEAEDGSNMVSRSFSRKYSLPQGAKGEDVMSNLSSDGVLVITAPKATAAITN